MLYVVYRVSVVLHVCLKSKDSGVEERLHQRTPIIVCLFRASYYKTSPDSC